MASDSGESSTGKIIAGLLVVGAIGLFFARDEVALLGGGAFSQPGAEQSAPSNSDQADPSNGFSLSRLELEAMREHPAPREGRQGQYGDPYAAGQLALTQDQYRQSKSLLMARTARAAYAAACSVINSVYVSTIEITGMNMIAEQERATGFPGDHPELFPLLRAIEAKVYRAVKAQPSACEYWHQNPREVALVREEAALSN